MSAGSLGEYAIKLAKTPLGIIALFVLFAEAIASAVVGASPNLTPVSQVILVIFISLFPTLVVFMFWHLITRHNLKLYAPSEFPNRGDFLEANRIDTAAAIKSFKDDVVRQIQNEASEEIRNYSRGKIEAQAKEYIDAVKFIEENNLTSFEVKAIASINNENMTKEEAEKKFGAQIMNKLSKIDLISYSTGGAATVAAATQMARFILRMMA